MDCSHLYIFEFSKRDNKVVAHAADGKGLVGGRFELDYPSVGATETLMMAACMAQGNTLLSNVAQEPEIIDLACFLTKTRAHIEGAGTDTIRIHGKSRLLGTEYRIMPDRIETGTFMIAAAITRSCISMSPVFPGCLSSLIDKLSMGEELAGFVIKTLPYPGFPTDLQPQTMALLSTCNGLSIVEESVFENRMTHVRGLQKLGAKIQVCENTAFVSGKENGNKLRGTRVVASDLRGGMSLVLAGLAAEGVTEVNGISHIDRGYETLEKKLQLLGAHVIRL
ncbi:UDP-n-acetylglucosamine 1-carboxyvinyltransferase [Phtheirospermum japonicum]|uniref:UDP-N-acetylglucosamine 1-carboxyvinyltransferase n=1 Tax=Phtheirospermum japonicum TaxID=374723 RepID=A0A830B4Z0_9LAMI|nr:UDP-n-acetylglucosamine 1-carboxyvinyltransferase [Phtheirospermum japonicum]